MYQNKKIGDYTYETRFIASWLKVGGTLKNGRDVDNFREWLENLKGLSEDDVSHIVFLATNGKLELEVDAKKFMSDRNII